MDDKYPAPYLWAKRILGRLQPWRDSRGWIWHPHPGAPGHPGQQRTTHSPDARLPLYIDPWAVSSHEGSKDTFSAGSSNRRRYRQQRLPTSPSSPTCPPDKPLAWAPRIQLNPISIKPQPLQFVEGFEVKCGHTNVLISPGQVSRQSGALLLPRQADDVKCGERGSGSAPEQHATD